MCAVCAHFSGIYVAIYTEIRVFHISVLDCHCPSPIPLSHRILLWVRHFSLLKPQRRLRYRISRAIIYMHRRLKWNNMGAEDKSWCASFDSYISPIFKQHHWWKPYKCVRLDLWSQEDWMGALKKFVASLMCSVHEFIYPLSWLSISRVHFPQYVKLPLCTTSAASN